MNFRLPTLRRACAFITLAVLLFQSPSALATIDDAHSFAMEAAIPFVKKGFIVREDYWNGEVKSGQRLMVKHQMFKGNEYAFWLGCPEDDAVFELLVLDEKGNEISLDFNASQYFASARVNPPKTGTYTVIFSVSSKRAKSLYWALAYGYH
ncbi:MAG TPA: hypothetical protein DIT13_03470 [Verrucomicrobiales bacterium]|nr:hypothetical protein [Verrucomicrobiales bacterium]HRJ08393.1 hypothetical protein [Prosthecobacter sp.]HRK16828.1 hypothetical protein [Prosthecobacter sp.]